MRRHRERTVALLAEKDGELSSLRLNPIIPSYPSGAPLSPTLPDYMLTVDEAGAASGPESLEGDSESSLSAIHKLLARDGTSATTAGLLHFKQEIGRREVEIATLRKQKRVLEASLRETQQVRGV